MQKEPVRHHYIPRFILRAFCDENGCLSYYDLAKHRVEEKKTEEVFMARNLYRDTINNPDNPTKIEADLARFEQEVAPLIKRFLSEEGEVKLSVEEDDKLKLFFAIMSFRSENVKDMFSDSATDSFKNFYSFYQEDGNLNDLWKRNLGELVNCRSLKEVLQNPGIDQPIKLFMRRDTEGLFGMYFIPAEVRGSEDFVISDCYPAVFQGSSKDEMIKLNMYLVYPISPKKALFLAANGVQSAPLAAAGFRKEFFRKPSYSSIDKTLTYRFRKIYEEDVKMVNDTMFENANEGIAFRDYRRIHNVKLALGKEPQS